MAPRNSPGVILVGCHWSPMEWGRLSAADYTAEPCGMARRMRPSAMPSITLGAPTRNAPASWPTRESYGTRTRTRRLTDYSPVRRPCNGHIRAPRRSDCGRGGVNTRRSVSKGIRMPGATGQVPGASHVMSRNTVFSRCRGRLQSPRGPSDARHPSRDGGSKKPLSPIIVGDGVVARNHPGGLAVLPQILNIDDGLNFVVVL